MSLFSEPQPTVETAIALHVDELFNPAAVFQTDAGYVYARLHTMTADDDAPPQIEQAYTTGRMPPLPPLHDAGAAAGKRGGGASDGTTEEGENRMRTPTARREPRLSDYEAGEIAYQNEMLHQQLERARKQHWTQSPLLAVVCCVIIFFAGIRVAPALYDWWYGWEETSATSAPLPTASVPTRPAPTSPPPRDAGATFGPHAPPASPPPAWSDDAGGPDLQLPAALLPTADQAAIDAWLAAPVSTPTPTRGIEQAVMDAAVTVIDTAFDASFQDAPACSPFIGYLPGNPCIPELTALAAGE